LKDQGNLIPADLPKLIFVEVANVLAFEEDLPIDDATGPWNEIEQGERTDALPTSTLSNEAYGFARHYVVGDAVHRVNDSVAGGKLRPETPNI